VGLELVGTGIAGMIADRQLVDDDAIAEQRLRQRLRSVVLEIIPNKWGLRGTLFRIVDHAPSSVLLAMRDRIRELVA
jgi:hypothetical protein